MPSVSSLIALAFWLYLSQDVKSMDKDSARALKIAKTLTKGRRRPREVRALYAAGLTPNAAAKLCGTDRDIIKQAWAKGNQRRQMRADWIGILAKAGIDPSVWRSKK